MKKMIAAGVLLTMLLTYSCQKQPARYPGSPASDADQVLLQQAEYYFAQQGYGYDLPGDPGDSLPYARTSLHKTPLWGQAQVLNLSFGKGIAIPVNIAEPLTIRIGAAQQSVSASALTWLLMYQDSTRAWHAEVLTRIPFSLSAGQPFQGEVRVEDWTGHFLKAYAYTADSTRRLTQSTIYRKPQGAPGPPLRPLKPPPVRSARSAPKPIGTPAPATPTAASPTASMSIRRKNAPSSAPATTKEMITAAPAHPAPQTTSRSAEEAAAPA